MSRRRFALPLLLVLPLVVPMAGCGGSDMAEHDYRQHFPVGVGKHDAVAVVTAPPVGQGLAVADRATLDQLGREHIRRGAGPVSVAVGTMGTDAAKAAARTFGAQVAAALSLPPAEVTVTLVPGGQPPVGSAVVTVPVWVADLPSCGTWDQEPTPDLDNGNTANFGCATQRNIGLMVQNPADLVRMRDATGRDANRAVDVIGKYDKGASTGSAKEDTSGSTASDIGK